MVQGYYDLTKATGTNAVVGGTGRYRGASGEYEFRQQTARTFRITLRLDPAG